MSARAPKAPVTPDQIRRALASIPADIDRETWVRLGMAVKSELGDDGYAIWDEWSQGSKSYKDRDAKDTWRSIKSGGRVRIGTLLALARKHGFTLQDSTPAGAPVADTAAQERLAQARARQRELEAAKYRERADRAAREARRLWDQAHETTSHAYLQRKAVGAYGVRALPDGTLLVPMRDECGELQNVQRIAEQPPSHGSGDKRFLPGGRKTGLACWLGEPTGSPVLLLAEGYATAATLHEATRHPVAVAFDAGNLVHVAKWVRQQHPAAVVVVCADDDQATAARTQRNPGLEKAAAAARATKAPGLPPRVAVPKGLPEGGSDFNDLAAHAGLTAVQACVATALEGEGEHVPQVQKTSPRPHADEPEGQGPDDPFVLDERGVWHVARDAEGNRKRPQWLCTPLKVTARTRADDGNGWGYLLEFHDPDGHEKVWAMPSALLSGEGSEWAGRLRDMGLHVAPGARARNLLAQYIDTRNPEARVTCTDRVGWHAGVYVLPSGCIGQDEGRRYVFQSEAGMEDTFRRRGTLAEWQTKVARLAAGNSRAVFTLCCAFAGPMLRLAGMESGGFHLRSASSLGKTSALRVSASVWGRPDYMQRWRTTDNALEATAVQHCDGLLILDEFGQLDPRVAGECAYMLANGAEKGRATRGGLSRRKRTWQLLFLSSGEVSLADHMAEGGKRTRAGMEVRMVDIPLDAGCGMGGIERLHEFQSPGELTDAMVGAAARSYGTAGRAWLEWACRNFVELPQQLHRLIDRYRDELVPEAASEQVRRVGARFALVAAAGELATQAGVTGWQADEAFRGVRACFNAWLAARGHMDNGEEAAMLSQVRAFLEKNGEALFTWTHRGMDDHKPNTPLRCGFRRMVDAQGKPIKIDAATEYVDARSAPEYRERTDALVEYLVLPEAFRRDMCKGFDPVMVARLLAKRGHLHHEADRLMVKHRLPGMGKAGCYHILPSIFSGES